MRKIVNQTLRIHSAKYVTRRSKKPKIDYFADKIQVLLFTRQTQSHEGLQIFPPPPNQITISFIYLFFCLNFTVQLSKRFLLVIDTTTCNKKVWSLLPSSLLCCFLDGGNLFFIVRRHMLRPKNYQHFSPKANAVLL